MRVGSSLSKMESKSMVTKMTMPPTSSLMDMEDATPPTGASPGSTKPARVTGKRTTRDEPLEFHSGRQSPTGPPAFPGLDMSSLGRELMERKRQMLSQAAADSDMALAKGGGSDDDSDSALKGKSLPSETSGKVKSEPLTEEDIQKRKAQRRREQVRAASRRCRDRQRRETEELRMKVFQLEEFISHSMQSYELELRRQRQQIEILQLENDNLRACQLAGDRPASALSVTSSPASVGSASLSMSMYGVKQEPVHDSPPPQMSMNQQEAHFTWDPVRIQNMHETVENCKRAMIAIQSSSEPVDIRRQAFGWNFDFWSQDTRFFVKTHKFFRGMRARDVSDRNFNVDYTKYIETFPEVKEKKVVQVLSPSVQIVEVVKHLPGKGLVSSLTAIFLSRDEHFDGPGERWAVGTISVGSANHVQFSHEDECNGYIFEDATQVTSDGREIHGCVAVGTGRFEAKGKDLRSMMEDMAKIFASVVIRWESLFINDYMEEEGEAVDEIVELDF